MSVIDINVATGQFIERDFTPEELAQQEIDLADAAKRQKLKEEKAAQRADLLDRLGITEAEAKLLLS